MGTIRPQKKLKAKDNSVFQKTTAGFEEILSLTTSPLSKSKYKISFNVEARNLDGTTSIPKVRLKIDGAVRAVAIWKNPDDEWDVRCGFDYQAFAKGDTPTILLEGQRKGGSDTIEFQRRRIIVEKLEK